MARDIEAAKAAIIYLQPDAASDPEVVREYEAAKEEDARRLHGLEIDMRLTGMMETGRFHAVEFDAGAFVDRMVDYFVGGARDGRCGCWSLAGNIPPETPYWNISPEDNQEMANDYFELLLAERFDFDFVEEIMTDPYRGEPGFDLLYGWFLERNPDMAGLLAQIPSCDAVDAYIANMLKEKSDLIASTAHRICDIANAMSEEEYLEFNLRNDEAGRKFYEQYILGI